MVCVAVARQDGDRHHDRADDAATDPDADVPDLAFVDVRKFGLDARLLLGLLRASGAGLSRWLPFCSIVGVFASPDVDEEIDLDRAAWRKRER